jgi:hypothetical protein
MEEITGDEGGRTPYLNAASVALYQLSYVPRSWKRQDEQKSLSGLKRSDLIQIFGESCHRKSE